MVEDVIEQPIVNIVDRKDTVTETYVLHKFDIMTINPEDMDFTMTVCLEEKMPHLVCNKRS